MIKDFFYSTMALVAIIATAIGVFAPYIIILLGVACMFCKGMFAYGIIVIAVGLYGVHIMKPIEFTKKYFKK